MTSWDLVYYLLRANYDRVDSAYLANARLPEDRETDGSIDYRPGCSVTGIEDLGTQVKVNFTRDGKREEIMADLLVAADGPSSTIRKLLEPGTLNFTLVFVIIWSRSRRESFFGAWLLLNMSLLRNTILMCHIDVERTYAGYCVIRGTVPEDEASQEARDVFLNRFCFFHAPGIQNLTYTIAGLNGNTTPGHRLLNFVWYANFPAGKPEIEKIMTDKEGRRRHVTIPPGMISWDAWELLKAKAIDRLPPQMAEMAQKAKEPFVQAITDVIAPKNLYMGDKVVLLGDALAGFRPHTVASTSQAAFNVMSLVNVSKYPDHKFLGEAILISKSF
jgi:2-polyprenyl-6-methoxyphenol hydroxylase-like FAD-dependent oxidoreductase